MTGEIKGTIFKIKRYALHDGPGIRTTVFFKGCPLSCWWCHNPESQRRGPELVLRPERCIDCGSCTAACPGDTPPATRPEGHHRCNLCGRCAAACPAEARELAGRSMTI